MAYILFKNITPEEINTIVNFLNLVSTNSNYGPQREEAVGICITTITNKYTYLSENMCTKDNPHISWVMCRKEYFNVEDFINAVKEHINEYNLLYKEINESYENRRNNG